MTMPSRGQAASPYYYWGSIGYHRMSAFGRFPYPPRGGDPEPSREPDGSRVTVTTADIQARLGHVTLADAVARRASCRTFHGTLSLPTIATVLWGGYGVLGREGNHRRVVPSAGGLYPLTTFVAAQRVGELPRAIYRVSYSPAGVHFHAYREFEPEEVLAEWFSTQHIDYATATAVVIVVGDLGRCALAYGERAYRMLHLDAGHLAHGASLHAAALHVPHVCIAGFDDARAEPALGIAEPSAVIVHGLVLGGEDTR